MPHIGESPSSRDTGNSKKRKRSKSKDRSLVSEKHVNESLKPAKDDFRAQILLLESRILESRKNYNDISALLQHARARSVSDQRDILASVALCRVFCRLLALGCLSATEEAFDLEATILQWLKERLKEFEEQLLHMLEQDAVRQTTALTLLMRLVKERAAHLATSEEQIWRSGTFASTVYHLVTYSTAENARENFIAEYVEKYDDVRYHTFARFVYVTSNPALPEFY